MFRFRLWGFPVAVHPSHIVVTALLAWAFSQSATDHLVAWPVEAAGSTDATPPLLHTAAATVLWMLMISLSVLVHELGHALTSRWFGRPAHIELLALGGRTATAGTDPWPWHQDILHTLAGPAAGLLLGATAGATLLVWRATGQPPPAVAFACKGLFYANLVWTALNLLPMATLDGGRIASVFLTHLFGRGGFLGAQLLSLLLVSGLFLVALATQDLLTVALAVLLGLRTTANIRAWHRGELPGGLTHPAALHLVAAERALAEERLEDAERAGRAILDARNPSAPSLLKARAHVLLGWVALKQGRGQPALEHLLQVRSGVPPQVLATAYALAGDDERALPLWTQAAREAPDELVLQELAGVLLRARREAEARRIPGVKMAAAYVSAARILAVRGEYTAAAEMAEAAFREQPSSASAFGAACAYGRAHNPTAAMRMLALAAQNGFTDAAAAGSNPDLQGLWELPEFRGWLAALSVDATT